MTHLLHPTVPFRRRILPAGLGTLLLFLTSVSPVHAQPVAADETVAADDLLAAFAYNFCLFTTWPKSISPRAGKPFVILVAGRQIPALAALKERRIHQRPVAIQELAPNTKIPEDCDVLVCNGLDGERQSSLLASAGKRPILTMSRDQGFCSMGGIVEFFVKDNRMRFRVSRTNMKQAGLRVQSQLLKLAVLVPDQKGGK